MFLTPENNFSVKLPSRHIFYPYIRHYREKNSERINSDKLKNYLNKTE